MPVKPTRVKMEVTKTPDQSILIEESPSSPGTVFRVNLKNTCSYPTRLLVWMDEETGHSTFSVFRPFEKRELTINLLTFRHLQRDPKVRMSKVEE
jgi:hypothetical protein